MPDSPPAYTRYEDIDWPNWQPVDRATLLFLIDEPVGSILLIHKKRGLGKGKINGPGGRIEPGETAIECAIREVQEELCVTGIDPVEAGTLSFQFADGYSLHGTVFTATRWTGTATETDEAVPRWTPLDAIPYDRMWADDILWMPAMLEGRRFDGSFLFDGDAMLGHELEFG